MILWPGLTGTDVAVLPRCWSNSPKKILMFVCILFTLPVGLVIIQQGSYIQRSLAFAAAFIASAPVLIFYAIFQHRITAGITTTGMAGR